MLIANNDRYKIQQIMPASGWRAVIANYTYDAVDEEPIMYWALVTWEVEGTQYQRIMGMINYDGWESNFVEISNQFLGYLGPDEPLNLEWRHYYLGLAETAKEYKEDRLKEKIEHKMWWERTFD